MIIYLDIDGVMVPATPHKTPEIESDGFYKFTTDSIQCLNSFKEDIEIVLISSHKDRFSKEQWVEIFKSRGVEFTDIHIAPGDISTYKSKKEYIEDFFFHSYRFIIIDDDKSLREIHPMLKPNIIIPDPYIGLTINDFKF